MRKHLTPGTRRVTQDDLWKLQGYTPREIGNDQRPLIYNHYLKSFEPTYHIASAHHLKNV